MTWVMTSFFAAVLLLCLELGHGAQFLLTVPKSPYLDTQYTATVSAFGLYQKESVSLEYRGLRDSSRLINATVLNFEFDGVQTWTVVFPWARMEKLQESAMTLTMSTMYQEEKKTLYFNKDAGFIFIQTDKPLYTPRQTVKFRIIAVDEYQRLAKYPLKVDIRNDKLIVVDRMRYSAEDAFKAQEFVLPKETTEGNWTITANFEGMSNVQSSAKTVSFEVKEYVLPRFSATIEISKDVITKSTHWIAVAVKAKYVYGQFVMGNLEMQLGIWDPKTGVTLLPQKYSGNLTRGMFKMDIRVSKLIPKEMILLTTNRRLYINVNVTEDGTQENYTIVDTSTFIAHPHYEITYAPSKTHFKPGFPYTLHTVVRARSGRPASWLNLWVKAIYTDKNGKKIGSKVGYYSLDMEGKILQDFDIPKQVHSIKFKTVVLDFKAGTNNDNQWVVPVLPSPNGQYMHVSLARHMKKYADGLIKLRYTPPYQYTGFGAPVQRITVMVMARGHMVYSTSVVRTTDGRSMVSLPKNLYMEISPSMRIVASFHHKGKRQSEFVIDSLQVDTDEVCVEELSLQRPGGIFSSPLPKKPKDKYNLKVRGGPAMNVGFVAVDTAIFLLNDAHSLTRNSWFKQLGSHDQGKGSGDGLNMQEVMKNSGLVHMLLDSDMDGKVSRDPLGRAMTSHVGRGPMGGYMLEVNPKKEGVRSGYDEGLSILEPPPQSVRRYFPESWLFEEHVLPKSGRLTLNLTLPDSITTWSFMAVGLSSNRGVCVSRTLEQKVQKLFFVDVRLPYKATRLEEVKVRIAVYNYHSDPIDVNVKVSGSNGLCFSSNRYRGTQQNSTSFRMNIGTRSTKSRVIKVIPLTNGDLTLRVDVYNVIERDIVERELYVVAEGLRQRKSLTFVLDPEAKHATYMRKRRNKLILFDTSTLSSTVDIKQHTQTTKIDLAMPRQVIRGTEKCRISAFGDLMGDIINHAVIKSKSLMDHPVSNAEEVLGDLGPTVHALLYANQSGLMNEALSKRARKFVTHGVARLLRYRKDQGFALTPKSPQGTWLTAAVLKTLCWSSSLAFIDKELLIDHGFFWLVEQVTENQTLTERDWRLAQDSWDYQVMLTADVLIAILECQRQEEEDHEFLMHNLAMFLEDNIEEVTKPMVLAKVAYGLTLYDPEMEATQHAVKALAAVRKRNNQGQVYWSSEQVTNERKKIPFWYRKGVKASAIEASAYALLVFLQHPGPDVNAIADWLVSQRNEHGAFVSALDSMAAIQALSSYSLLKSRVKLDLSCNVTSDRKQNYFHAFKFTEENAMSPESLNNVPVGQSLEVLTKGQGLGQMHVNVEYNIPIDPNEKCSFNVSIEVKRTEVNFYPNMIKDPLCMSCSWGCRLKEDNKTDLNVTDAGNGTSANATDTTDAADTTTTTTDAPYRHVIHFKDPPSVPSFLESIEIKRERVPKPPVMDRLPMRRRRTRSVRGHSSASRRSICVKVCLQHLESGPAGHTRIAVDMLTGYLPVTSDVDRLKEQSGVLDAWYMPDNDVLMVVFKQVSDVDQVCFSFRAVDHEDVGRPTPATVLVTEVGNPAPSCALEYHSPSKQESLQVYCADFTHSNRGECRCYSGLCSSCSPVSHHETVHYSPTKDLVCAADIGYKLEVSKVHDRDQWVEIDAKILSVNKTGSHKVKADQSIKLMSPTSCFCPAFFSQGREPLYLLSTDVEKMVDRYGNKAFRYLLDEQSVFLRVSEPSYKQTTASNPTDTATPSVPHSMMELAFNSCRP